MEFKSKMGARLGVHIIITCELQLSHFKIYFYLCMSVCACMSRCSQRPEESVSSPELELEMTVSTENSDPLEDQQALCHLSSPKYSCFMQLKSHSNKLCFILCATFS